MDHGTTGAIISQPPFVVKRPELGVHLCWQPCYPGISLAGGDARPYGRGDDIGSVLEFLTEIDLLGIIAIQNTTPLKGA